MQKSSSICKKVFSIFLISFVVLLSSCKKVESPKISIGKDFYYWESTAESNLGDAMRNMQNFKKLEDYSTTNLRKVLGQGSHFVWVRAEFEIPLGLKNRPLGMVIPHLKFAEQVYCNGTFISQYGAFPPHEQSTLFKAHFFSFPLDILNQDGKNLVLIKIFAQGKSGISSHAFIQFTGQAYQEYEKINFNHTRIYMLLEGILIFTFILYMAFYISVRSFKEFRDFALLNIFTAIFLIPFFATELPFYTSEQVPFLLFYKVTMCIPMYFMIYFATLFAVDYHLKYFPVFPYRLIRLAVLLIQILVTIFVPTFNALVKITPFLMTLLAFQAGIGISILIRELFNKKTRKLAIQFFLGFSPLLIFSAVDLSLRIVDNTRMYPFFAIFGWQLTIVVFIIILAVRFSKVYSKNEQLSNHLLEEVAARTHDLEDANFELSILNERLEKDKRHSEMDLEMAALVQHNFFPKPNKHFKGWEIAVCYSPQSKVSGDFYDYYNYNDILNGLSVFDVSGHGLSASLVTMLSKNIISRVFQTGLRRNEPIDKVLTKINNMILSEKGNIDNYMTGILCRFTESEDSTKCSVELGNAGHPYPLKFSVHDKEIYELKGNDGKKHYGAIGMKGITVSFARSNFFMTTGDILILYTDGITEATNKRYDQFGLETIKDVVKKNHARSAEEIAGLIIEQLEQFTEYKPLDDDITLIIAKRKNPTEFEQEEEHYDLEEDIEELAEAE